jgi:hypothetical protein
MGRTNQCLPEGLSLGVKQPGREADLATPIFTMFYECLKIRLRSKIKFMLLHERFHICSIFSCSIHFQGIWLLVFGSFIIFSFLACEVMFFLYFVTILYLDEVHVMS